MKKIITSLAAISLFIGCALSKQNNNMDLPPVINYAYMDTLVRPQDDFYQFVNGNWMKTAEIPADRSRWGSFDELRKKNDSVTLAVLNEAIEKGLEEGTDQKKAADFFASVMDTATRNQNGLKPLKPYLDKINALSSVEDIQKLNLEWAPYGGLLFRFYTYADSKNSDMNANYLIGASLGMGRDYYQKDDEASKEKLVEYETHIANMFKYLDDVEDPQASAAEVVALEKQIGKSLLTIVERRDANKRYNKFAVEDLKNLTPSYDFSAYLDGIGVEVDSVIISEVGYFKTLENILQKTPMSTLKAFAKWNLLNGAASMLSMDLERENFEFYGKKLRGTKEMRPLEERALSSVNGTLGEAVGKLYVEKTFPPAAKDSAKMMVGYIRKAFEKHIQDLTWMSDSTKTKALEKLSKFKVKIGYPDKWEDYSQMEIKSPEEGGTYFDNAMAAQKWAFEDNLKEVGKPVDKSKWGMPPQTVNAYFNPLYNEIVFPAAILQPPFFNFKADAAVNFGAMGAVIGHEISHGFDDSGADYDGDGNLKNWWSDADAEAFENAGKALAAQYNAYEPLPGVFVNGEFTLGENIGDLGGVNVALTGLNMYLEDKGNPGEIDGFTPNQRFFISWATIWRTKSSDEALKNQVKTDPHSPGYYRAVGPIINVDAFHEAFDTQEGDEMYVPQKDRITIW